MVFTSTAFFLFFPVAALLYYVLPMRAKKPWLLAVSYFYYMYRAPWYGILLAYCTLVTYLAGLALAKQTTEKRARRRALALGLVLALGMLAVFKYTDFAVQILNQILSLFSPDHLLKEPGIALPVGISFFTLQAVGYLIDVYRGTVPAEHSLLDYALFVSFFPQLLAGPIGRAKALLPQLRHPRVPAFAEAEQGLLYFLWGAFLKLVIADRASTFVDTVYGGFAANGYAGSVIVLAVILFGLQLYCDFYGYTMMAAGCAKMLGIELAENFRAPYLSGSVQAFWRDWHISLSSWFRDYLYFPLGGSRCSRARTYANLLLVFLVSGLWHGASWSFVFWGGLNGLFLVLEKILTPAFRRLANALAINTKAASFRVLRILVSCAFINFTWIFFRADSLSAGILMIQRIFAYFGPGEIAGASLTSYGLDLPNLAVLFLGLLILLAADLCKLRGKRISSWLLAQNRLFRELVIAGTVVLLAVVGVWGGTYSASGFIYFQF